MAEPVNEFPEGYSKTYLKTINNQLTCIINYAKRFYDLNTNPCGQAGCIGQAKAEEMDTGLTMSTSLFGKALRISHYPISAFRYYTGQECARENFLHLLLPISTLSQNRLISTKLPATSWRRYIYFTKDSKEQAKGSHSRFSLQGTSGIYGLKIYA